MFDRLRELRPRNQWLLATVVALLMGLTMVVLWMSLRTTFEPLLTGLRPAEAATVLAELDRRKIDYRLADGGRSILVPADRLDSVKVEVLGTDLPQKGTVGFELFNKSDIGLTDFAQRINYQRALQGELERTIMGLDGVESVRVHLSMGESRVFRDDQILPKASITIRMRQGSMLPEAAAYGIERLVAAAVPQLTPELVVIVDEEGRVIGQRTPSPSDDRSLTPLAESRRAVEDYYEAGVRRALQTRTLPFDVAVEARAVLPADAGAADVLSSWAPDKRTFPLSITLRSSRPVDDEMQTELRSLATGAIGFDAAKGDAISFGSLPAQQASPAMDVAPDAYASPPVSPRATDTAAGGAGLPQYWLWGLLAAGAAAAGLIFAMRRRAGDLSEAQRDELIGRLRTALSDGEKGVEGV